MKKLLFLFSCLFAYTNSYCQWWIPDEKFGEGQYWETDAINYQDYPYTTFKRNSDISISQQKLNIISLINVDRNKTPKKGEFYMLYNQLWQFATNSRPGVGGDPDGEVSRLTAWSKALAFIYFIGIDPDGNALTASQLENFGWNAEKALLDMNTDIAKGQTERVSLRARELLQAVQAYDLLKAAGRLKGDRNRHDLTPRDNIRQFARNLFNETMNGGWWIDKGLLLTPGGWKKNHGIALSAALATAAIVFNECGASYLFDGWKANNWARLGHWGMIECLFEAEEYSVSKRGGLYSYSEGPSYFEYGMFETATPFFIAFNNFVKPEHNSWTFPYGRGDVGANNYRNYLIDNDIYNLYEWYHKIQLPDGSHPTYDNTHAITNSAIGIFNWTFNIGDTIYQLIGDVDLRVDYMAALGGLGEQGRMRKSKSGDFENMTKLEDAGNIVLRMNQDSASNRQYFHMLFEKGIASDIGDFFGGTHEDNDVGSFILAVDRDELAIDPAYIKWHEEYKTNQDIHHNSILFNGVGLNNNTGYSVNYVAAYSKISDYKKSPTYQSFTLDIAKQPSASASYTTYSGDGPYLTRNVNQIMLPNGKVYYLINDYAYGHENITNIAWQLNGNGNINEGYVSDELNKTFYQDTIGNNRIYKWSHPCSGYKAAGKWNLFAHLAVVNGVNNKPHLAAVTSSEEEGSNHGSDDYNLKMVTKGNIHTRVNVKQNTNNTVFQSFLMPYRCNDESSLPYITKEEYPKMVITRLKFRFLKDTITLTTKLNKTAVITPSVNNVLDTNIHLHIASTDSSGNDSLINPFGLAYQSNHVLKFDAKRVFIQYNTIDNSRDGYKYCPPSYANIRQASISNGTKLYLNDTIKLIDASAPVSASITMEGRYYYKSTINPLTATGTVKFYLPDVGRGVDMEATIAGSDNLLSGGYDSLSKVLTIAMPDDVSNITIKQKKNCFDCYFPPSSLNIVDTFFANDGGEHTLGHKLKVLPSSGNLLISNGTRIDMCEGVYLRNKNNIVIESECQTKDGSFKTCDDIKIDTSLAHSKNSAIIVGAGSALVLDANSYTYIKNGGAIYVKRNGTLFIKNGAFVQIGDSGSCSPNKGWGEIVAEDGAYINIQDNAHIEFRRTIGDTVDRNLFYIPRYNPPGIANAGNYPFIHFVMFQDTLVPDSNYSNARAICDIATYNPIKNKEWGYSNIMTPKPFVRLRRDTICPSEPVYIDLKRFLNDNSYKFKVCRMDSLYLKDARTNIYSWVDTCIVDTMSHDTTYPDPKCMPPHAAPDYFLYYFKTSSLHRITFEVSNDCGVTKDTTIYVFVTDTPKVSISMPSQICEGVNSISITKLKRPMINSYSFQIAETTDSTALIKKQNLDKGFSKRYFDTLPNSYNFENYHFRGGRKYSVSLTLSSVCKDTTLSLEVHVPLATKIVASKPTIYENRIGNVTSVTLNGYLNAAAGFLWTPSYALNRTDTLSVISNSDIDKEYFLVAWDSASCITKDSITIRYNTLSYLGNNDTMCMAGNSVLLGNRYNAAMFLGWLNNSSALGIKDRLARVFIDGSIETDVNYLRYFDAFMHTSRFKQFQHEGCYPYYDIFTSDSIYNWEQLFRHPFFKTYYNSFLNNMNAQFDALDDFNTFIQTSENFETFNLNQIDESSNSCFTELFSSYNTYYNHIINNEDPSTNDVPSVTWYKIVGKDTSVMTQWQDMFAIIDTPIATTTYIQQVIHASSSLVEYDSRTVFVDASLVPLFYSSMQWDSSAYFTNATSPSSSTNNYLWDFGDGSATSTDVNPFHTFPAFNTQYIVCLTATNTCGYPTYCDTVWIDSLHLGGSFKVTAVKQPERNEVFQNTTAINQQPIANNCQLSNYPNPFDQSTIIDYEIWQTYSKAELRITNVLGQEVYIQRLNRPMDKVQIDGSALHDGLYYYSLIVDGAVKLTKTMSVIR